MTTKDMANRLLEMQDEYKAAPSQELRDAYRALWLKWLDANSLPRPPYAQ